MSAPKRPAAPTPAEALARFEVDGWMPIGSTPIDTAHIALEQLISLTALISTAWTYDREGEMAALSRQVHASAIGGLGTLATIALFSIQEGK